MGDTLPRLTPPELEIMNAAWDGGELTVTEIMNAVNATNEKPLTRSTIQVQIFRLEDKGWLRRRGEGNKFLFTPTVPRDAAAASIAQDLTTRVFGGSCVELVKALFGGREKVSPEDIHKLRELLNQYEEDGK